MNEQDCEELFVNVYLDEKELINDDYIINFAKCAVNGLIKKFGVSKLNAVLLLGTKKDQNIQNEIRWILETGTLLILFDSKLESDNLKITQKRLMAIMCILNKYVATNLVKHNILSKDFNTLFNYRSLEEILEGSQYIFMKCCYDNNRKKIHAEGKNILYNAMVPGIAHLIAPQNNMNSFQLLNKIKTFFRVNNI